MNDAERFEQIFLSQVTRPGADKLLEWLKSTDFFTAPASTRFHGAYPGGLVKHSLNVYYALLGNFNLRGLYSPQTQTIVALLHDVCKANYYAGEYPDYTVKDQMPMGHGEKSVYLVMKHMELTDDEALAIRWHMGAYCAGVTLRGHDSDAERKERRGAVNGVPAGAIRSAAALPGAGRGAACRAREKAGRHRNGGGPCRCHVRAEI